VTRLALAVAVVLGACGGIGPSGDDTGGDDTGGDDAVDVFDPAVTAVDVEIDYETGEAPYTGDILAFGDTFDITVGNLGRVFSGTKALSVPRTTAAMQDVGPIDDEELTTTDLLALAATHRQLADTATRKAYYLIFVSGNFADGDGVQPGVLGVSIGRTGVVAMFKDVIESTRLVAFPNLERFVEQSTLVHELGHAIGLVDNGVAMVADHKDAEHGAHCSNQECVMYWLNEGASDAAQFARDYVTAGDAILFGDECLGDVDALTGGP
jgi:hypothetical protein